MNFTSISSIVLAQEAEKLWLKVIPISHEKNLFYIVSKSKEVLFKSTDFWINPSLSVKLSNDKELSHYILKRHGIPMTDTLHLKQEDVRRLDKFELSFPLIIKPIHESHWNGVKMNILDIKELEQKLTDSFKRYKRMIVQSQVVWDEYRLLVFNGRVILSIMRIPASVLWNGKMTLGELIEHENNTNILRWKWYSNALTHIRIDDELIGYIAKQKLDLNSIPNKWDTIQLIGTSNIWTGWTMIDVSDIVSDDIKALACKSAEILWLGIAGVDIITSDITKSLEQTWGIILEVNDTPWLWGDRELTGVNTARVILQGIFF